MYACHENSVHVFTSMLSDEDDFVPVSTTLRFERCGNRSCTNILIELDGVMEETETFTTTLERPLGLDPRIRLTPVDAVVTVLDGSQSK